MHVYVCMHAAVSYLDGEGGGNLDLRGGGVGRAVGSGQGRLLGAVAAAHDGVGGDGGGIGGESLELVCRRVGGAGEGLEELDGGVMQARRVGQDEA